MAQTKQRTVGLFDIRVIIGGLIGLYGLILTLLGLFSASDEELAKGDGLNINLWAGLSMLAVGIFLIGWARLRPVIVPDDAEEG
jgi:membrane-bound ClpP family serine protease